MDLIKVAEEAFAFGRELLDGSPYEVWQAGHLPSLYVDAIGEEGLALG